MARKRYRQRAFDLAQRIDRGEADVRDAATFLRGEIVIGPRSADLLAAVLRGFGVTKELIDRAHEEVGDIDDVVPF